MSTKRSVGRITATQEKVRSTSKSKKDRSTNLCAFTFADGRQCRTPRCSGHLHFCYFHAQKEAESLAAQQVGQDISRFLPTKLLTACDLGVAMSRLFCAVARGEVKPKVASTLAYLAQTMLQSIPIAQHEYIESFNTNTWRNAVRVSFRYDDPPSSPAPQPAPKPPAPASATPTPVEAGRNSSRPGREPGSSASSSSTSSPAPKPPVNSHSEPAARREESASSSNSSLATHHPPLPQPPQPAPSPHTPLPPTSTEFAQQVLAGRNSSQSEIPTQSAPARQPGPSDSSSAPSSDPTRAQTSSAKPAPSSPAPPPSPSNSQPAPAPPATQSTSQQQSQPTQNSHHNSRPTSAPPPLPPGFGAPANWDVLISPKPRRRFSRLWQSRE